MPLIDFFVSHYILMILLLAGSLINGIWLFLNRKDLKMNIFGIILFSIFHSLIGVIFVMLFAYIESGFDRSKFGSVSIYGGTFFMPLVYFLYALIMKIKFSRAFDIFSVSLIETLFFARINCIISGCCEGILIPNTNIRVPTREIELLYYLIFLILVIPYIYKNKSNGYIYPLYLLSYGVVRFISEFFRVANTSNILHNGHISSIVAIILGVAFILYLKFLRGKKYEEVKKEDSIK